MKFLTKKWYELCQETNYDLLLRVSEKATVFSEEYYQKLYQRKLKAFLKLEKDISDNPYEEDLDQLQYMDFDDDMTPDERNRIINDIKRQISDAQAKDIPEPFDIKALTQKYKSIHEDHINRLTKNLPSAILDKVIDIRVLALDVVAKQVKESIHAWCQDNQKRVDKAVNEYQNVLNENMKRIGLDIVKVFTFHDCVIIGSELAGGELIIKLDTSGGFTNIDTIIFHNCKIIEKENDLEGAWWLYEEIYPLDNGNEYHALLWLRNEQLAYLTVFATAIEFIQTTE